MKCKFGIIPLLLALIVSSCEMTADIPVRNSGGRLYLECFPSDACDTTVIKIAAATPISDLSAKRELTNIVIDLKVNGCSIPPEQVSAENSIYVYHAPTKLKEGDEISIKAGADGYPLLSALSLVPKADGLDMSREIYNYRTLRHKFAIRRDDNSGERRFYGVHIKGMRLMETFFSDAGKEMVTDTTYLQYNYKMFSPVETPDKDILDYKAIRQCEVNGMNLVIFEDDGGKTKSVDIVIDIPYESDMYRTVTESYKVFRRTLYSIDVFDISDMAYEYLNPNKNQMLIGAGLIPPVAKYGNVVNGYGIMSGMGCVTTGWVKNL